MASVALSELRRLIGDLVRAEGMKPANAEAFTDVYMRSTLRGVGHHDIYDLPGRLEALYDGKLNPNPGIRLVSGYEAIESYDGDNGPGELCSVFIMDRAVQLSRKHGIGLCTVRSSNHFLAAAPYVEKAAEAGVLASIFTRTPPCMGITGAGKTIVGNAPMGFAAETADSSQLLVDICMAYASYGTLNALAARGESVPDYWGADAKGKPTTDPGAIARGGVPYPVGGHKGFALSLFTEILTGVLSGGQVLDEENPLYGSGEGIYSQTAVAIRAGGLMPMEVYKARVSEITSRLHTQVPGIHLPGQGSREKREGFKSAGCIDLKPELVALLNGWADKLAVRGIG